MTALSPIMMRELAQLADGCDTFEDFATQLLHAAAAADARHDALAARSLPEGLQKVPEGHGPLTCSRCHIQIADGGTVTTDPHGYYIHMNCGGLLHWPLIAEVPWKT